jgi:hypothetical protein
MLAEPEMSFAQDGIGPQRIIREHASWFFGMLTDNRNWLRMGDVVARNPVVFEGSGAMAKLTCTKHCDLANDLVLYWQNEHKREVRAKSWFMAALT